MMMKIFYCVGMLLGIVSGLGFSQELIDLKYEEKAKVKGHLHVAREQGTMQMGVYLTVDNLYTNSISCSGGVHVLVERDGIISSKRFEFHNLLVFPARAFPYQVAHRIAVSDDLPEGMKLAVEDYPETLIDCRGWDFLQPLPSAICLRNREMHDEICGGGVLRYPLMIDNFWLGSCQC